MLEQPLLQSSTFSQRFDDITLRLLCMKRDASMAEARVAGLNDLVNDIWKFGLGSRTSLLGPIIQTRNYMPKPGGHDSGQVIQSALLVPGGLGVVVWDSECYLAFGDVPEGLEAAAAMYHVPFELCSPVWRALLNEHIQSLTDKLFDMLVRT